MRPWPWRRPSAPRRRGWCRSADACGRVPRTAASASTRSTSRRSARGPPAPSASAARPTMPRRAPSTAACGSPPTTSAATLSAAERLLGRRPGTLAPAPTSGALRAEFVLDGSTTAPRALGWVESPSLTVGPITGAFVHADVHYDPSVLRVPRLEATWQGTAVAADATVGLTGAQALDARLDARGLDVAALLGVAGQGDVPASGRVDLQATASGTVASPQARVSLTGTDLQAYGEVLGTLRADAGLAGREVVVDALTLDKPQPDGDGRVTASARYHLDRREAAVDVRTDGAARWCRSTFRARRRCAARWPSRRTCAGRWSCRRAPSPCRARAWRSTAAGSGRSVPTPTWPTARRTSRPPPTSSRCRPAPTSPCERPTRRSSTRASTGSICTRLPIELETPLTGTLRAHVTGAADLAAAARRERHGHRGGVLGHLERPSLRRRRAGGAALRRCADRHRHAPPHRPGRHRVAAGRPAARRRDRARHAHPRRTRQPRLAGAGTRRPARRSPPPATWRCRARCAARCRRSTRR